MAHTSHAPHARPSAGLLWQLCAVAAVGLALCLRPCAAAGTPGKAAAKGAPAPTSRTFYIPAGAQGIKDRQAPKQARGVYHIQAGGDLTVTGGACTYFVEAGGALTNTAGAAVVIVKKGGKVTHTRSLVHLFAEKGAQVRGLDKPRHLAVYDSVTLAPLKPFTLRGVVTAGARPAPAVKVHAFGLGKRHLASTTAGADGTFTFQPAEEVAWLVADFSPRWAKAPQGPDLDFRLRVRPLRGWEAAVVEGSWAADASVRLPHPGEGPLNVQQLHKFPGSGSGSGLLVFSPNGRLLASEDEEGRLTVWDLDTGKERARLGPFKGGLSGVAFSPDGALLAVPGQGGTVLIYRTAGGKKVHALPAHKGKALCVAFTPDGRGLASGGEDSLVKLWDPATGKERSRFKAHDAAVRCLA